MLFPARWLLIHSSSGGRNSRAGTGKDQDHVAGGGEGEAAAERASATRVCWVRVAPEWLPKTSSV